MSQVTIQHTEIRKTTPKKTVFESLITKSDLSIMLGGVPPKTIDDWVFRRKIPCFKVGRRIKFDPVEIRQWLSEKRVS